MSSVGYFAAFVGGFVAFLSPCVLPLIPSYVSFITGVSFSEFQSGDKAHLRKLTIVNSAAFIIGFTTVFVFFGMTTSLIGNMLAYYKDHIRIAGGILAIFFGLYVMGVFKIRFLSSEQRVHLKSKPKGFIGSLVVGFVFAAGWTPCIGPIIASIAAIAATAGSVVYGFKLMIAFSLGLAIPFMATSLAINTFLSHFGAIQKHMRIIMILSGLLLIGFGLILLTDNVHELLRIAPDLGIEEKIEEKLMH